MSLVLEALSKAEKLSKKDKYIPSVEQEKIGEIKTSFQKKILLILAINLVLISIILGAFFSIYFLKNNNKTIPLKDKTSELEKNEIQNKTKNVISENVNLEKSLNESKDLLKEDNSIRKNIIKKNFIAFENGPEITINGVIIDEKDAFVMIDGDMYKAGENIDGAKIKKITIGKVFIEYEGKDYEVRT